MELATTPANVSDEDFASQIYRESLGPWNLLAAVSEFPDLKRWFNSGVLTFIQLRRKAGAAEETVGVVRTEILSDRVFR